MIKSNKYHQSSSSQDDQQCPTFLANALCVQDFPSFSRRKNLTPEKGKFVRGMAQRCGARYTAYPNPNTAIALNVQVEPSADEMDALT